MDWSWLVLTYPCCKAVVMKHKEQNNLGPPGLPL